MTHRYLWIALLAAASDHAPVFAQTTASEASLSLVGIDVVDMEKAKAFYVRALGMRPLFHSGGPSAPVEEVGLGFPAAGEHQTMVVLVHHSNGGAPLHPAKLVFRVADAQSIIEHVRAAGYTVVSEPHHSAGSPFTTAMARDAEGTLIEFFQLSAAP